MPVSSTMPPILAAIMGMRAGAASARSPRFLPVVNGMMQMILNASRMTPMATAQPQAPMFQRPMTPARPMMPMGQPTGIMPMMGRNNMPTVLPIGGGGLPAPISQGPSVSTEASPEALAFMRAAIPSMGGRTWP